MPKEATTKTTKAAKDTGDKKEKKLSPYMAYMKEGIAKYKEEHPGVAHKEAFSKVASMWGDADENPNKGKAKAEKKPKKAAPKKKKASSDDDVDDE